MVRVTLVFRVYIWPRVDVGAVISNVIATLWPSAGTGMSARARAVVTHSALALSPGLTSRKTSITSQLLLNTSAAISTTELTISNI